MGYELSVAADRRALCLLRDPGARLRGLELRAAAHGRPAVARSRVARGTARNLHGRRSASRRVAHWAHGHPATALSQRRAWRREPAAIRRARADGRVSPAIGVPEPERGARGVRESDGGRELRACALRSPCCDKWQRTDVRDRRAGAPITYVCPLPLGATRKPKSAGPEFTSSIRLAYTSRPALRLWYADGGRNAPIGASASNSGWLAPPSSPLR